MSANDRQVGGEHYRRDGKREKQHWDLMAELDVGYFPAVITKYVERHADKAKRLDLEKALHYAEKYHEVETDRRNMGSRRLIRMDGGAQEEAVADYVAMAGLDGSQALIFHTAILRPDDTGYLVTLCRRYLEKCYATDEQEKQSDRSRHAAEAQEAEEMVKGIVRTIGGGGSTTRTLATAAISGIGTPEDGGQHAKRTVPRQVPVHSAGEPVPGVTP